MTHHYRLYGLGISSDIALLEPEVAETDPDVSFTVVEAMDSLDTLADRTTGGSLLHFTDGRAGYVIDRVVDGYRIEFPSVLVAHVDAALTTVRLVLAQGREPLAAVLIPGAVLALVLQLRGEHVLHASAVVSDGVCTAFVGGSGMGKSTLAALASVVEGVDFFTDDVLRVERDGAGVVGYRGSQVVRLRDSARSLEHVVRSAAVFDTTDGRRAVRFEPAGAETAPLGRIVVPVLAPECDRPWTEPIAKGEAGALLGLFPRTFGWRDVDTRRRQFMERSDLAARVSAVRLYVPVRAGFTREAGEAIAAAVLDRNAVRFG